MKIDNGSLPPTPDRVPDRVGQSGAVTTGDAAGPAGSAAVTAGDAIHVSGDAKVVAQAARAIGELAGPDTVRPDVVERAKAALARGEVGADVDRLADRLIDGMLDE